MAMFKYVLKRIALGFVTFCVIITIVFTLIKLLQPEVPPRTGAQAQMETARREALGYNKPIMTQLFIFVRNAIADGDFGTSWHIEYMKRADQVFFSRFPPTIILNIYSMLLSLPIGILLGIWAAIRKNKPTDHFISTFVMLFISVPSFVVAFLLQYTLGFRMGMFPLIVSSLFDAGGRWTSAIMLRSMVMPVLSLSFGVVAGLARSTRAELTEALTSEYMLLARAKGLTKSKAIVRHAMRNAMVPILPGIVGMFFGLLGGSIIIEMIFGINGVGKLYLQALRTYDYDVFMVSSMFYTVVALVSYIVVDLSYGFLDPRIRMGER